MDLAASLTQILEGEIFWEGIFLVELVINDKRKLRISIFVDADEHLDIDACAKISRKLGAIIEERNLIEDAFVLEVSSPGVDKPLKLWRQYPKHIGRKLQIELNDGQIHTAWLREVAPEGILVETVLDKKKKTPVQQLNIAAQDIKLAQVLVEF